MTERERLIELIKSLSCGGHPDSECLNLTYDDCKKCGRIGIEAEDVEKLADHLLSNGVIVPPCKVGDMVDVFFSCNAIVHLWCVDPAEEDYSTSLWRGMAWNIPQKYKEMKFEKFFGTVPEHLYEADAINILVDLTKAEAEEALEGRAEE